MMPREATLAGRLAALGFADTAQAERLLSSELRLDLADADADLMTALAGAPDPDLALAGLAGLRPGGELLGELRADAGLRARLIAVLGVSAALAEHLRRHPDDWRLLRTEPLRSDSPLGDPPLGDPPRSDPPLSESLLSSEPPRSEPKLGTELPLGADEAAWPLDAIGQARSPDELKIAYRRGLLDLAARDLTGATSLDDVMAELSELAGATLRSALAIGERQLPAGAAPARLAVIAMGKCGARELNYASDVDVIFVAHPQEAAPEGARPPDTADAAATADEAAALRSATQLARAMIRICSEATAEGILFPVDPNLRPEGRSGPLVRTIASYRAYYERWAKTWEFQALLKARPVAGDRQLGQDYLDAMTPLIWQAAQRADFVADVQAMRRRVIENIPARDADRELKLGPGGLRDIEFAVQLLQLVHGRADETLRDQATLPALAALAAGGYVGRQDAAALADAYRFLRAVEHLLQLRQLRRTHSLPTDQAVLRQLGRALRSLGYLHGTADPADELNTQWRRHATVARQLHEKLFYRPLLDAVARLPGEVIRLTSQAATARLEALGYADPAGALRHIEALTTGMTRKAAIQRTLLPALLGWLADAPAPDPGLLAFRQVSEALGDSPWYLRLLRDDTSVAWRMTRLLISGRYAVDLLLRAPAAVAMLAGDDLLAPREPASLAAEADAVLRRYDQAEPAQAVAGLLAMRRTELFRIAAADVLGLAGPAQVADALTTVTTVTLDGALKVAARQVERSLGELPTAVAVIAMGRFGGRELGYGSDADVLFVHQPLPGAAEEAASRAAHAVADGLRRLLGKPGPDPVLLIDADLRPEGRQGPLARTLQAYLRYYERWSAPWETQALLRAAPVAGDQPLGAAFLAMADELRYPDGGLGEQPIREIKRIKARIEAERMPRGVDPALQVKLGPGGLSDTEWVAQLIQLRHAAAAPALRTTQTLPALAAAREAELLAPEDEEALRASWLLATRIRNAAMLVTGRATDVLPSAQPDLAGVARLLGYSPGESQQLLQDWRRTARRARAVMERVFYG